LFKINVNIVGDLILISLQITVNLIIVNVVGASKLLLFLAGHNFAL